MIALRYSMNRLPNAPSEPRMTAGDFRPLPVDNRFPLRMPDLVAEVAAELRRRILSGELEPEMDLPTTEQMSESFGVSRTVVREALRHLQAQELITVARGRRPRVKPVDAQAAIDTLNAMLRRSKGSLENLLEVRQALEVQVAAMAARRASPEQLNAMSDANEDMLIARRVEDRIRNDWTFHEQLAEASHNPLFVILTKTVSGLFQELLRATAGSDVKRAYEGHARLLDALRRHDDVLAQRIVIENLAQTREDLQRSLASGDAQHPA